MQLNLPPDLEILINKRLSSGAYDSAEDVVRRALEAQEAEENWTEEERRAIAARIDDCCQQALRGEVVGEEQVWQGLEAAKRKWRAQRPPKK
jgi:Arc/MetJ-type ribon-helix-helix transcriptional regulator